MRKFTKEHNEIGWLFPSVLPEDNPEEDFNTFEERGKFLFEEAYQDKEAFTKDDMMDAFGQTACLKNRLRITNNHYQSMTSVILKMKAIIKSAIWLTVILVTLMNGIYVLENFVKQFITS